MFKVVSEQPLNLAGRSLVIPAVSVGNSGTLALDLILNSQSFTRQGWIYTPEVFPIVGQNALDAYEDSLTMPLELFASSDLLVLQIRTVVTNPKEFSKQLVAWCLDNGIVSILVLGSNWDEMKVNEEEPEIFYIKNSLSTSDLNFDIKDFETYKDFLSGAGLTKPLLEQKNISAAALIVYGKKIPADVQSGFKLAQGFLSSQNLHAELRPPKSWQVIL
jgi:predicted ATP-grasp superfamily ATP-dependent carboligase